MLHSSHHEEEGTVPDALRRGVYVAGGRGGGSAGEVSIKYQALAFEAATADASAAAINLKTPTPSLSSSSRRTSRSSTPKCTLNDLGAVLRDIKSEYADSPVALNRIRAALGHLPDAYDLAVKNGAEFIWGKRQVWAPDKCGI